MDSFNAPSSAPSNFSPNAPGQKSKHLSQPYHMHQSISSENLPALFGAASLRRTNSNVTSKSSRPPRVDSPNQLPQPQPQQPQQQQQQLEATSSPSSTSSSFSSASPPIHPRARRTSTTPSLPSIQSSHQHPIKRSATPTSTPLRQSTVDMMSEGFDLESNHIRRPSSWDIMDMVSIDQLRQWMVCFCVVNFDLEKGQAIESVYPPSEFTPDESKNICFSSFPDSNTFDVGDTVFNFRIRSATAGRAATGPTTDAGFLYGYVFFRQKQDPSIRRGYFQKSVVLLSQHPFIGLFSKLVSVLGPAYFEVGKPMLEAAFHNMATWRPPTTEGLMELPFMGTLLQVQLAKPHQPQLLETSPFDIATYQPDIHILSSVPMNGGLYKHFQDLVPDLWLCWELMTLAEPIMLVGTSPEVCSESVASLVDLINPIPYCGDYRPYFTIQDTDFKSFCNKASPPSSIILGVTNPFFAKSLEHWPHVIKIGKPMNRRPNSKILNDGSVGKTIGSPRNGKPTSLEFVQGVVSKRKGAIAKDTNLLCMLAEATANRSSPGYLLDNILRKYFATLTEKFLVPLNRYFATLVPNDISLSSTSQYPHIAPFKQQAFLKFLSKNPPAISFKTSTFQSNSEACQSFYKDFLKCGNFATWLRLRTIAAQNELRRRYLEILSLGDVARWVKGRNEVELVDLLVRMREELGTSGSGGDLFSVRPKTRVRPDLSREDSHNSTKSGSDPLADLSGAWSAEISNGHRRYADERNFSANGKSGGSESGSGSGSGSEAESQTRTPPIDFSGNSNQKSHPHTPTNGSSNIMAPKAIPSRRPHESGGIYSVASSFSSSSSRTATPSRSSSSSSLNTGWVDVRDASRESSPDRQRHRYESEASAIKATMKQKEQLRDQIRLLVEALPVDLRESLKANEAKKRAMATMSNGE